VSFADYGRPRRVDGGLRARSTRGAIGRSWWSRRFVDVLESFALGTRLTRGRSYARAGQVISLDVAPGVVTASVQGSRSTPYRVGVQLPVFPEPVWGRIEGLLAAQALFSARLLAGDVPPELERLFADAGAPLFPATIDELRMRCSCPDVAVPCKHLAATFYLLAEAFDADPFRLLHWRGRDRAGLLARLRALRGASGRKRPDRQATRRGGAADVGARDGVGSTGRDEAAAVVGAALALADLTAEEPVAQLDRFWLSPVPLPDRPATLATGSDLLLRQLGAPGAAIGGPGLSERLRRAYRRLGAADGHEAD
jgi:uncharacterized Zn finger protein